MTRAILEWFEFELDPTGADAMVGVLSGQHFRGDVFDAAFDTAVLEPAVGREGMAIVAGYKIPPLPERTS